MKDNMSRIFVFVPNELKKEIDYFRFNSHTETKNKAVVRLIERGLKAFEPCTTNEIKEYYKGDN